MADTRSLEARLDALESREQITQVLYRYCRGWDRRDEALINSCYWPGAAHRHGVYDGSAADFTGFGLSRTAHVLGVRHTISNVMIELDGDRALSECHFAAIHRRPNKDGTGEEEYFLEGRYIDRFERRGGEWRIVARRGLNEFERVQPAADTTIAALPAEARGRPGPDDALYALQAAFREGR
jgi:hypothetical protein